MSQHLSVSFPLQQYVLSTSHTAGGLGMGHLDRSSHTASQRLRTGFGGKHGSTDNVYMIEKGKRYLVLFGLLLQSTTTTTLTRCVAPGLASLPYRYRSPWQRRIWLGHGLDMSQRVCIYILKCHVQLEHKEGCICRSLMRHLYFEYFHYNKWL